MSIIQARSPYYYSETLPAASPISRVKFSVYANKISPTANAVPEDLISVVEKSNPDPSVEQIITLDVSPFLQPFFEYKPQSFPITGLEISHFGGVVSTLVEIQDQDDNILQSLSGSAAYGYTSYLQGANALQPAADKMCIEGDYFVADKSYAFTIPFLNDGDITDVTILGGGSFSPTPPISANGIVNQLWIDLSTYNDGDILTVNFNTSTGTLKTIKIEVREECRFEPVQIHFLNRFGQFQIMTFFKNKRETLVTRSEQFQPFVRTGASYDPTLAQTQRFNARGLTDLEVSSGFLPESSNKDVQQLLLSEHCYIYDQDSDVFIPVKVQDTSKQFQTRLQDKLISHTVQLQYAFNLINNA